MRACEPVDRSFEGSAQKAGIAPCRTLADRLGIENHDVGTGTRQIQGRDGASDAAADDRDIRLSRQITLRGIVALSGDAAVHQ